jgi:hypothetical protein
MTQQAIRYDANATISNSRRSKSFNAERDCALRDIQQFALWWKKNCTIFNGSDHYWAVEVAKFCLGLTLHETGVHGIQRKRYEPLLEEIDKVFALVFPDSMELLTQVYYLDEIHDIGGDGSPFW